jgi:Domain of unknown function (DUF3854)
MSSTSAGSEPGDDARAADFFTELAPDHALLLRQSAITPIVASARGYESVNTKSRLRALGFSAAQQNLVGLGVPALLIPIHGIDGSVRTYELRPNRPRLRTGKPIKYERPQGSSTCLDIPNLERVRQSLRCGNAPLFITEGARKVDAAVSQELLCIGILGVNAWRGTQEVVDGVKGLIALAEWEYIHLKSRRVYFCFDSDYCILPLWSHTSARRYADVS